MYSVHMCKNYSLPIQSEADPREQTVTTWHLQEGLHH